MRGQKGFLAAVPAEEDMFQGTKGNEVPPSQCNSVAIGWLTPWGAVSGCLIFTCSSLPGDRSLAHWFVSGFPSQVSSPKCSCEKRPGSCCPNSYWSVSQSCGGRGRVGLKYYTCIPLLALYIATFLLASLLNWSIASIPDFPWPLPRYSHLQVTIDGEYISETVPTEFLEGYGHLN